jgi:hypothetical protein
MPTKHTPTARLIRARTEYRYAYEACPHWDEDGEFPGPLHTCCERLIDAQEALRRAKAKAKAS